MGRDRQRASWSTSQCADDPGLRHAVHLPLTVGHPLWVQKLWGRRQRSSTVVVLRKSMEVPP